MTTTSKLPDRPSLENLKKRAKHLHKELKAGDPGSVARVREHLPRLSAVPEAEIPDAEVTLQEVQHVVAVEYGYANWNELLDDVGRPSSTALPMRRLYGRPSLENLQWAARDLRQKVESGEYARRVKKHLSRLAEIPDEEIRHAGVTLEEAQQVIAAEYQYSGWDELGADVGRFRPVNTFEDLADLEDSEIREIISRVGRDDLAIAMKAANEHFKDRFLGNMPEEERRALTEYMELLGPMLLREVEEVQRRIADKFRPWPSDDAYV